MTSRRSPPRRSSGSSPRPLATALALLLAVAAIGPASAAEPAALATALDGVSVDWSAGALTASGGAAADLRMPSVDLARPGAERRARAAALARLRAGLRALPLGGGRKLDPDRVDRALGRARAAGVEYQSNGGAVVRMTVGFSDWLEDASPATVTLFAPAARLAAAPLARVAGHDVAIGAAEYRLGHAPAAAGARSARLDHAGRLEVEGDAALAAKLARGVAVIYVGKVLR
jgi:hypothetical protein